MLLALVVVNRSQISIIERATLTYLTKQLPTGTHRNKHSGVRERRRFIVHVELRWLLQYYIATTGL